MGTLSYKVLATVLNILLYTFLSAGEVVRELVFEISENVAENSLIGVINGVSPPFLLVGLDSDLNVDQSSAEIRSRVKLDREIKDTYSFVLIPIVGESVRVSIVVLDVNDNPPVFTSEHFSVEFPENTPRDVKRTLSPARDKDSGIFNTQRYIISSGNINNAFRLNSHRERDGVLYLDLQVNGFLDRETTPFYNLVIDAFDGGVPPLRGSMIVHVSLTDVNDNSPIFNQSRYFGSVAENATIGTPVLQVFATDTDSGPNGQVVYSINRRQTDKDSNFRIDLKTGLITVNRPLDYEVKETHELVVVARDEGLQSLETTVFVTIRVLDINDHQPTFSIVFLTDDASRQVLEGSPAGEFLARVSLIDPESKSDYTHANITLTGTQNHFGLTKRNGQLYIITVKELDRENIPEYTLTLNAVDPNIPGLNATTSLRIAVADANDNPPQFTDKEVKVSVSELAEVGTHIYTVRVTDPDTGPNAQVTFSLDSASSSAWFEVEPMTGRVKTRSKLDCEFESVPRVTIVATDNGNPPLSSSMTLYIQIRDVNDNEPTFDQSYYNVTVAEDTPVGKCILKVSASDADCGINSLVNYTLQENFKKLPFRMDPSSGEICIMESLDYELKNAYEFSVIATDAGGLSSTAAVRIVILDVNDNDPKFYPKVYETTIFEDVGVGNHVLTLKAIDADSKAKLTYNIVHGNSGNHFAISSINSEGRISLQKGLNLNSARKFVLNVKVSDEDGRSSNANVTVNIVGTEAGSLKFEHRKYTFRISEDAPIGSSLGYVAAIHSVSGKGKVTYSISSGDPTTAIALDKYTGQITTAGNLDYEKYATVLLNVEARADDSTGYAHTQVEIEIVDVNDNIPEFDASELTIYVSENISVGTIIYGVHAVDDDNGKFGEITYHIYHSSHTFNLNTNTGALFLRVPLDYESIKTYKLTIGAKDHGIPQLHSKNLTLNVEVQDVNDNAPKFQQDKYNLQVLENMMPDTVLGEITAMDVDTGNNGRITYKFFEEDEKFAIGSNTGIITLKSSVDRETKNMYELKVVATDHGIPSLSSTAVLIIRIIDVNDNDPKFERTSYEFSISENNRIGEIVGTVLAFDRDDGENGAIRYLFQPSSSQFQIHPISGVISAVGVLDRERESYYELQAVAVDQGHPSRQSETIIHMHVKDVNDCSPVIIEPEDSRMYVKEDQPIGTLVGKIQAKDDDLGNSASLIYSIINDGYGGGSTYFSIHPDTGTILTKTILKQEERPIFSIRVEVKDKGHPPLATELEYRIEVLEVDDNRYIFTKSNFNFKVSESLKVGEFVCRLKDEGLSVSLSSTFVILRGNSEGYFQIDKSTGGILLSKSLDYETSQIHSLQIRVNDPKINVFTSINVNIHVTDVNDNAPYFQTDPLYFTLPEDTTVGSQLWNITAMDQDAGINGLLHYSIVRGNKNETFKINMLTGALYLLRPLDYEYATEYVLVVQATDQPQNIATRLSSNVTIKISIGDVNNNSPVFISPSKIYILSSEGTGADSWVHNIVASDIDSGSNGHVTYELISGNEKDYFALDSSTGQLTLSRPLDSNQDNYYLKIRAKDHGVPSKSSFQNLHINVNELKSHPPVFSQQVYEARVTENALIGTPVIRLTAESKESRFNYTLLYTLPEGLTDGKFSIHSSTGAVFVSGGLDREIQDEYKLLVYVHESQSSSLFDTTRLTIRIIDVNDNAPELICPTQLHVPENEELGVIYTFSGTDPDVGRSGEITWSITNGNNNDNLFSIDLHSGEFKSRPLDRERKSSYVVMVTAQDQGLPAQRTSCNLTIIVMDNNDNSPKFYQNQYEASVDEDAPIGTIVINLGASDADAGLNAAILYSLHNETNRDFQIDNKTGAITVANKLNRERIGEYMFEVVATDGGLYDSRSSKAPLRIKIRDTNNNSPVFTHPILASVQMSPHSKIGHSVFTFRATDPDLGQNGEVSYSLTKFNSKFRIHPHSGVVTLAESISGENGKTHELIIVAKDQGNPQLLATAVLAVQIGDVQVGNSLKFTESKYEVTIAENSVTGTNVVEITGLRSDGRRQNIVYKIIAGNQGKAFEINQSSGMISVVNGASLDRETRSSYSLVISATTESSPPISGYVLATITLTDENDNTPKFSQDIYTAAVWEGNSKGAFAIQLQASDADEGSNANLVYYIVEGNEDNAFVIDPPSSGVVKTNIVLDREIREEYYLTIVATDEGSPQLSGTTLLQVKVIDVNDNLPIFPPSTSVKLSEGTKIGSLVTTMTANDVDTNPDLVYSFTSKGNPGNIFSIGKYDGRILLRKGLDFETEKQYVVSVQVSDSVHSAFTNLTVNVEDYNDSPPVFTQNVYEVVVSSKSPPGVEILQVKAIDMDTDVNAILKYSIIVPNNPLSRLVARGVYIDEDTGKIYKNASLPNQEISFAELTLVVSDSGSPKLSSKATLWVEIQQSENEIIKFVSPKYSAQISRDTLPGTEVLKLSINEGGYRNRDVHVHYAIAEGNINSVFAMSSHSGEIVLTKRLENERIENYNLTVSLTCASAPKCSSTAKVTVQITPSTNNIPTFNQSEYRIKVSEKMDSGSTILNLGNRNKGNLLYNITSGNTAPSVFIIDSNASLKLAGNLNYEVTQNYKLIVSATNTKTTILIPIYIEVEDANDYAPTFPLSNYIEYVGENEPIGTTIFAARAIDLDAGLYGTLNYSILESSARDRVNIQPQTGIVTAAAVFDYETMTRFTFTLRATDKGGLSSNVKVTVEIESRDEYEPVFSQGYYRFIIPSNAGKNYIIGNLRAVDQDQGSDGILYYTIDNQNHGNRIDFAFRVNRTTGQLFLKRDLESTLNSTIIVSATSNKPNSKSASAIVELLVGPPSPELGLISGSGMSEWLIGLLLSVLLLLLVLSSVLILIHLKRKRKEKNEKRDCVYDSTFDAYAQSTMLAGANSHPTSIYSPQYSDLGDLRRIQIQNVSELSEKSNCASSGRGSAEDGEEVDEEIRMINEGKIESGIMEDEIDTGAQNTQEYLARLGIPAQFSEESIHSQQNGHVQPGRGWSDAEDTGLPVDISTLIYSQIDENSEDPIESRHAGSISGSRSLNSIIGGDEELRGSYNWDYLNSWGPQYQPLAHVFSEIARLGEDEVIYSGVKSNESISSSENSKVSKGSQAQMSQSTHMSRTSRLDNDSPLSQISKVSKKKPRGPLPPVPMLPRSPITSDPSFNSPLSPSFSPEISYCNSPPEISRPNIY